MDGKDSSGDAGGARPRSFRATLRALATKLPYLACAALFIFHFSVIQRHAVNVPYMDDWAMFSGDDHPASADLAWLIAQHNDHRITTTKFFIWLQFQWNGWNMRTNLLLNFVVYGLYLAAFVLFARRFAPQVPSWVVASFLIFLLSPVIWMMHFMSTTVSSHFWLLFLLLAAYLLFAERQTWPAVGAGSAAAILSTYSFASGVITSFFLLAAFALFKGLRARRRADARAERARELWQLALAALLIGGSILAWLVAYEKPPHHPSFTSPLTWTFWEFYLNAVSFGFGVNTVSVALGLACLLAVVAPMAFEIWRQRGRLSGAQLAVYAVTLGILADVAVITTGRAGFGLAWSKNLEYGQHAMPLIILALVGWGLFVGARTRVKLAGAAALWLFCFGAFSDNWSFAPYRAAGLERLQGARCLRDYYANAGPGDCLTLYPYTAYFRRLANQAKRLNASVYREVSAGVPPARRGPQPEAGAQASYLGFLDIADCQRIAGWAADISNPEATLEIAIYDGERLLATMPADKLRVDVLDAGFGSGFSGFDYPTPQSLMDGRPHTIRVKFAGTDLDLQATPKTLTCTK